MARKAVGAHDVVTGVTVVTADPCRAVLLLGATGFIGEHLLEALRAAGHEVVCGTHTGRAPGNCRSIAVDYTRDHTASDWAVRLRGIDVVINAIGILRETRHASFEALHVDAPVALFQACVDAAVTKVVQISALGADEQAVSRYHVTKKCADDALAALPLSWVIVQPSLVFGLGGRSAALFTQLAALPLIPLPGDGGQRVQPVHINDLTAAIVRLIATNEYDRERIPMVGPKAVTFREMLAALRRALGLREAHFIRVPLALIRLAAAAGDYLHAMLLDRESLGMLLRGNVASSQRIAAILGRPPRALEDFIDPRAARAAANEARLAWLLPLLRATVGIVWIVTAIVSFGLYPADESYAMLARVGLTGTAAALALYGAALLDLAFGLGIFLMRDRRWLWRAQMALIVSYSIIIAIRLPEYWLHPFGPLLKNLPLLAAILVLHEFEKPIDRKP
jgi:uncharacterized protein YbjT (DUF2867 family)